MTASRMGRDPLRQLLDHAMTDPHPPTDEQLDRITDDPDLRDQIRAGAAEIHKIHSSGDHGVAERLAVELAEALGEGVEIRQPDGWAVDDDDYGALADRIRSRAHGREHFAEMSGTLPPRKGF